MKRLYFECMSGISGDMTVGALLDLGADKEVLRRALSSIEADNFEISVSDVQKCGIRACKFDVLNTKSVTHRHLSDIEAIIDKADITENAKRLAKRMFGIVAAAEAKAHAVDINEVHFHEVGAIDSIVDIISTAVCIDNIGIDYIIFSPISEGCGYVQCAHGLLPVPVPAVLNIMSEHALVMRTTENEGEMVTPTGAAIAAALKTSDKLPDKYRILKTGIGAGTKDFAIPNVLRIMLIEDEDDEADAVWELSSNIDDISGEALGFTLEQLFNAGALDAYFIPIYMKKNRPAYMINVLCDGTRISSMEDIIFANTTTIGIRRHRCERTILEREVVSVETIHGKVSYKKCVGKDGVRIYPEYESVTKVAHRLGIGYVGAYKKVLRELAGGQL